MTHERITKLAVRWSFVSALLIVAFWAIWHLIRGSVPETTAALSMPFTAVNITFHLSRWWDILIGPIFASTFIPFFFSRFKIDAGDAKALMGILAMGIFCCFGLGFPFTLLIIILIEVILALWDEEDTGFAVALIIALGIGIASGIGNMLLALSVSTTGYLFCKAVSSKKVRRRVTDWLLAR